MTYIELEPPEVNHPDWCGCPLCVIPWKGFEGFRGASVLPGDTASL